MDCYGNSLYWGANFNDQLRLYALGSTINCCIVRYLWRAKKKITLDATRGLAIETLLILPFALGYYAYLFTTQQASFLHIDVKTDMLMIVSGIVTAVPLVLFAKGAQNIPLYLLGFIQYMTPTIVLILGVMLYKEPFSQVELLAFSIIWVALLLFSGSKIIETRKAHHKSVS